MTTKILVADDSGTIQKVIKIALAKYLVEVAAANSYAEALNQVSSSPYQVIIADCALSGTKAPFEFKTLSAQAGGTPIILLVGSYENFDEPAFVTIGLDMFVRKPFEAKDIVDAVGKVLGKSLTLKNSPEAPPVTLSHTPPPPPPQPTKQTVPPNMPSKGAPPPPPSIGRSPQSGLEQTNDFFDLKFTENDPFKFEETSPPSFTSHEGTITKQIEQPQPPSCELSQLREEKSQFKKIELADDFSNFIPDVSAQSIKEAKAPKLQFNEEIETVPGRRTHIIPTHSYAFGDDAVEITKNGFKPSPAPSDPSEKIGDPKINANLDALVRAEVEIQVRRYLESYCKNNLHGLIREIVTAEIRRLSEEKSRQSLADS